MWLMTSHLWSWQKRVLNINIYTHVDFGCYAPYPLWDIAEPSFHTFLLLCIAPLNLKCQRSNGHLKMSHINVLLTASIAFQLIEACSHSKQKHIFGCGHVTNDVIILSLIWELFYGKCYYLMVYYIVLVYKLNKVIWYWNIFSCIGFWEGSHYNYLLLL